MQAFGQVSCRFSFRCRRVQMYTCMISASNYQNWLGISAITVSADRLTVLTCRVSPVQCWICGKLGTQDNLWSPLIVHTCGNNNIDLNKRNCLNFWPTSASQITIIIIIIILCCTTLAKEGYYEGWGWECSRARACVLCVCARARVRTHISGYIYMQGTIVLRNFHELEWE